MLKFFVRHGMIVEKIHELVSFKQSKWLEKYINFINQKRSQAVNDLEKISVNYSITAFMAKTRKNVRKRCKIEFFKKVDSDKIINQQCKLIFNGIQKPYTCFDSYTFKQNYVLMDKPMYLGLAILELSKLHMYKT